MKKKTVHLFGALLASAVALSGCAGTSNEEYVFKNAGFEQGTLSGWTAEGGRLYERLRVQPERGRTGQSLLQGRRVFPLRRRGARGERGNGLTSRAFQAERQRQDRFSHRRGSDASKCYVAVCDTDGNELIRRGNDDYGTAGFYESLAPASSSTRASISERR